MDTGSTHQTADDLPVVNAENPWPGLDSFREADQRWFQGRRDETSELLRHVMRERMTVLFALSGVGKSSLLQAGLFPMLRQSDMLPVYIRLDHTARAIPLRAQVFDTIARAAEAAGVQAPVPKPNVTLWEYFYHVQTEFWGKQQNRVLPILVFDQFEEIFTLGADGPRVHESESFLDELADLADGSAPTLITQRWANNPDERDEYTEDGQYKILISMREDFLPEFSDQRRRIADTPQKRLRLRQMNGEGALSAVSQAKELVDVGVATQIVRFVAGGERLGGGWRTRPLKELEIEPALLSVVCRELNTRRRQRGDRKISADLLEGTQEQVLVEFYDRSFAPLPEDVRPSVRTFVEEQLITVNGARNSVPEENALSVPGMSERIIEQLVERRLLRREHRRTEVRLELTHDLLTQVVRSSRDARRQREAIEKERQEREAQLQKEREKSRRNRRLTLVFGVFAVIAAVLAVVASVQTVKANNQTAAATAASAKALAARKTADENARLAEERRVAAENSQKQALASADEATKQGTIARQQADIATQQTAVAQKARAESDDNAKKATAAAAAEQKTADENAKLAAQSQLDAARATKSAADATEAQKAAEAAKLLSDKEAAQGKVTDAMNLITASQGPRALGTLSYALTLDPNCLSALSLAFDQLLRGDWGAPAASMSKPSAALYAPPALTHPAGVLTASFSPDGKLVLTGARDGVVRLWNADSGQKVAEFKAHEQPVIYAEFSPDGSRIATSSIDKTARIWDAAQRTLLHELKQHTARVNSAVFSRDSKRIVTASDDRTAQVWDVATGAPTGAALTHPMSVNFAAFSRDGNQIVSACADHKARVFDYATGRSLLDSLNSGSDVRSAEFALNGARRVVTASSDRSAQSWDIDKGTPIGDALRHAGTVVIAVYSPDGKRVATASLDHTARVWEAETGKAITNYLRHDSAVLSVSFSPDGSKLVTGSDDKTARIWPVWDSEHHPAINSAEMKQLLEGLGKFSGASGDLPPLSAGDAKSRLDAVRSKTDDFVRWFFDHRQ